MKKRYSNSAIAITVLIVILPACQKTYIENDTSSPPATIVTASVSGHIADLNDVAISNAVVEAGSSTTTTDVNGRFTLKDVQLDKDAGFVKVRKAGYFTGSRTFLVNSRATNNIKIQLIPKAISAIIASSSGGNVDVTGGAKLNFNGSSFVNAASSAPYSGNVSVSAYYLNPADGNFNEYMPGDLRGVNTSRKEILVKPFGMMLVELNDAGGEKLQLAKSKTATVTIPIVPALQAAAPATTALWYFEESKGIWKEEGTATKQGNNYVGSVSHFSFWTAGQLTQSVTLRATFTMDTSGIAYANKLVTLSRVDLTTVTGYTDSTGTVSGLVPANETLTIKVFNDCKENVYSLNIGPFSADTALGSTSIANGNCYSVDTSQYINLVFNGNSYFWSSSIVRQGLQQDSNTTIIGGGPYDSTYFDGIIFGANTSTGDFPIGIYTIVTGNETYQAGGLSFDPTYPYPITTVTKYEAIGGYIEGTISGWIKTFPSTATADSFQLSGIYRVKRIQ